MGIVTMGIPQQIVIDLAKLGDCGVFVETGTFQGATTRWASTHFSAVHTIERARSLFDQHGGELAKLPGVTPHFGDSRKILPEILRGLSGRNAVHWLDGHWSGGETAGEQDECPVLDELACLSGRTEDLILIDDARLFLCAPPPPHDPSQWPTLPEIIGVLSRSGRTPFVQIVDDVIFVVPDKEPLRGRLVSYARERSRSFWEGFSRLQRGRPPVQ